MDIANMTKDQIEDRLAAISTKLEEYYSLKPDIDADKIKELNPRAYDVLIAERDRLTRALA